MSKQTASASPSPSRASAPAKVGDYDAQSFMVNGKHLPLAVSISTVTAWRLRKLGLFPAPIRLSAGRVAWIRSDLEKWVADRQAR